MSNSLSSSFKGSGVGVLSAVGVCILIIWLFLGFYLYKLNRDRLEEAAIASPTAAGNEGATNSTFSQSERLDPSTLLLLLIFVFTSTEGEEKPSCAICLTEFNEGERGRSLPKCVHIFHVECIDLCFNNHSTCPICRFYVQSETTDRESIDII